MNYVLPEEGRRAPGRGTWAVVAFAVAMGWLEAVVVVYIRTIVGIAHGQATPNTAAIMAKFQQHPWLLPTEQSREAATLVMLFTLAWMAADYWRGKIGAFLLAFGTWDIVYYASLFALVRWPPSLATMDLLFLIPPHPWWYQPVWVPVSISCAMIALGLLLFTWGRPKW
jgi:hypothetical protein